MLKCLDIFPKLDCLVVDGTTCSLITVVFLDINADNQRYTSSI